MTTTCPGCGAPKADLCRYCGRGDREAAASAAHHAACRASMDRMLARAKRDAKRPVGFWGALLGVVGGVLP